MQINSVSTQSNFGLSKGGIINTIFDAAKRTAQKQANTNPAIIDETNQLINRIQKRAPFSTLQTTGADFFIEKTGKKYYMTDIVPGEGLINSLKNLDIKLKQFDKNVKAGKLANLKEFVPPSSNQNPPIMVRINPDSDLGQRLKAALDFAKNKKS